MPSDKIKIPDHYPREMLDGLRSALAGSQLNGWQVVHRCDGERAALSWMRKFRAFRKSLQVYTLAHPELTKALEEQELQVMHSNTAVMARFVRRLEHGKVVYKTS